MMTEIRVKTPKKIIHCSDGTIEDYSTDEEENREKAEASVVDPKTLSWLPWLGYQTTWIGSKTLEACDYVGESLANFFGITAPKYQFEINEYHKMREREAELKEKEALEMGGWSEKNRNNLIHPAPPDQVNPNQIGVSCIS